MIKWKDIKEGHLGFEKLATDYVNRVYQYPKGYWKRTQDTRDGNKDAYTVIIGYKPELGDDEIWWMEAKYSNKYKYLTRFRLDATIVSSIFQKNLTKIIFVTNINIHSKTISDIRMALQKAINCEQVYFCTKKVLEYWLTQNPDIYLKYFAPPVPVQNFIHFFVSEDITIYPYPVSNGWTESCKYVYVGKKYMATFKVVSSLKREITIESSRTGICTEKATAHLLPGENPVSVIFSLSNDYYSKWCGNRETESVPLDFFVIDNEEKVLLKNNIRVLKNEEILLDIQAQNKVTEKLISKIQSFYMSPRFTISAISGDSGTGKTHVNHYILDQNIFNGKEIFYVDFFHNPSENFRKVLNMFLLIPCVTPNMIDADYLTELRDSAGLTANYIQLYSCKNNWQKSRRMIRKIKKEALDILPERCIINPRIYFLDNVQNLNEDTSSFLFETFLEASRKKLPVFIVLSAQSYFFENADYKKLNTHLNIQTYLLTLTEQDILKNLSSYLNIDLQLCDSLIDFLFPNIVMFINYLKYVQINSQIITSMDDFIIHYIEYTNQDVGVDYILGCFNNIFSKYPDTEDVCKQVYFSCEGVDYSAFQNKITALTQLLQAGLVKYTDQDKVIPYHDIYKKIFRTAFGVSKENKPDASKNEIEMLQEELQFEQLNVAKLNQISGKITQMRSKEQFLSIVYILEPVFETKRCEFLRKLSLSDYYNMYYCYAYAMINCSKSKIGYDILESIYSEIKYHTKYSDIRILCLEITFELINSYYNIREYKIAMNYYREFRKQFSLLTRGGYISNNIFTNDLYLFCENYRILIQSQRLKKKSEQMYIKWKKVLLDHKCDFHYISFTLSYVQTLYTVDIARAYLYTKEVRDYISKNETQSRKQWLKAEFQYLYLSIIVEKKYYLLPQMEHILLETKEKFYSSFRHRNLAYCSILYLIGDVNKANSEFLSDVVQPRKLRNKLKVYYYETLALYELFQNNPENAILDLEKALDVFGMIPGYQLPIIHNIKVLRRSLFAREKIAFYTGGRLKRDWYYIDTRLD